jgi:hypothetical protein
MVLTCKLVVFLYLISWRHCGCGRNASWETQGVVGATDNLV